MMLSSLYHRNKVSFQNMYNFILFLTQTDIYITLCVIDYYIRALYIYS